MRKAEEIIAEVQKSLDPLVKATKNMTKDQCVEILVLLSTKCIEIAQSEAKAEGKAEGEQIEERVKQLIEFHKKILLDIENNKVWNEKINLTIDFHKAFISELENQLKK